MSGARSLFLMCVLAVLTSAPAAARAALPDGYEGMAVHVTFDGTGHWERSYSAPAPGTNTYDAAADVTWHNEYDVPVPETGTIANNSPAQAGTTVTGFAHVDSNFLPSCGGPIIVNSHTPPNPLTPFIGVYGGPYDFDAKPPPVITLYVDTFGGYDYALCDGMTGILTGQFTPAGGGISWNYAIGIAKFDLDLNEWTNQPPHERTVDVSGDETAAAITSSNEKAHAYWSGTITLRSYRAGGGGSPPPGVSQDEKDFTKFEFFGTFLRFAAECFVGDGNDVFSGASATQAPIVSQTMQAATSADCTGDALYLLYLARIIDDPPDPHFHELATIAPRVAPSLTLPSCSALTGADRRFCTRLEKSAVRHAGKVSRLVDVAQALATTGDRLSAAAAAGDLPAAKRQRRAFGKLRRKLAAALKARVKAGGKLAALLQSAQVTAQITDTQAAQAIAAAVARLTGQGLAAEKVQTLAGANLTPQAIDVLAQLGGK